MLAVFIKFHSRNEKTDNNANIRKPEVRKAGSMRSLTDTAHAAPFFWRMQASRLSPKNKAERAPPTLFV